MYAVPLDTFPAEATILAISSSVTPAMVSEAPSGGIANSMLV